MRLVCFSILAATALGLSAVSAEAMPVGVAANPVNGLPVVQVAGGCGPGLVRGRLGTCLRQRAIFSRGRIVRKGCGKPIGAGLRTPC